MSPPHLVAFVLLFALTGAIGAENRRSGARAMPRAEDERRSGIVLGIAHTVSMLAGAIFPLVHMGTLALGDAFAWCAVATMLLAFALQLWSMRTLGRWFSLTLGATEAQPLVEQGPYRVIRHPGYAAQIVFWLAFGAASRNALAMVVIASATAVGYAFRIRTEERMLADVLGERWRAYATRRARLIPWIF